MRVQVKGKSFALGDGTFPFRGVTYGTFAPRTKDGARFPKTTRIASDFDRIATAGFTVVRTYTAPTDDLLEVAGENGLRVLAGVFYPDWRYLIGASRRQRHRLARDASAEVLAVAQRLKDDDRVVGITLGNEVPADVVRWIGAREIARAIDQLADVAHDADANQLVTYANYPTAEYLSLRNVDFVTFNVFLEQQPDLRRYLSRLHHVSADRPLVLGEMGFDAGTSIEGEAQQAAVIDWQLATALERGVAGTCLFSWTDEWWVGDHAVEGWHFGLTRGDRSPRPSLAIAQRWNHRRVAHLDQAWPSMSVVICAYNAASTLDECLHHTTALDYPDLEVIVVDDGSSDGTREIAARYPTARLISIDHAGLSTARNEGTRAARGDVIAFLDSDAYPAADWPYYLALGFDSPNVGGAGGLNLSPIGDPAGAQRVSAAPGGPAHVMLTDDRAEHVPGCNMAFRKAVLVEAGGFDPIYTAAGDDVDICWKLQERGWEIGFHPAAVVWHHRRSTARGYLRQQRGYARAEALVEARHPDRFTPLGLARWRGHIYDSLAPVVTRQRIYRGIYGTAAFQSVYRGGGYGLDLLHQVGLPVLVALSPLALFSGPWPVLAAPALAAATLLFTLFLIDAARATPPRGHNGLRYRTGVALLHVLQPLVRAASRARHRPLARQGLPRSAHLPGPAARAAGGVLLLPEDRPRGEVAASLLNELRRGGLRVVAASGWEDHDGRLIGSSIVEGDLVTTSHLSGWLQLRVRRHVRVVPAVTCLTLAAVLSTAAPWAAVAVLAASVFELARGEWRVGHKVGRIVEAAAGRRMIEPDARVERRRPVNANAAASKR